MTEPDITFVASDNAVTRRERRRQSAYREEVLRQPAGVDVRGRTYGNYLPADDRRNNFLSEDAAAYAAARADVVRGEGGQLEQARLFTNMLSSMPLAFNVFAHLRAHPDAAVAVLSALTDRELVGLDTVTVGSRTIAGIECEWAPERREHLDDGTAFDAVAAARLQDGNRLLIAVEVKYVDSFSRDPKNADKDEKYRRRCQDFGMADSAFDELQGPATRQLLRNVLLTESVRRTAFDEALAVVFARDDDEAARSAVAAVDRQRGGMPTAVTFIGHRQFADAASDVHEIAGWAAAFRRRYVGEADGR